MLAEPCQRLLTGDEVAAYADRATRRPLLMTDLRSVVSECRERGADIHKGMLLVDIKVEFAKLATGFAVWLTLCDAEMTPLDDARPLLADAGPIFPAARVESAEQRVRRGALSDLVVAAMGRRRRGGRDAAELVSIEDEHGILSREGGSWSFQTWDEIP
jgi:hypothetical protein